MTKIRCVFAVTFCRNWFEEKRCVFFSLHSSSGKRRWRRELNINKNRRIPERENRYQEEEEEEIVHVANGRMRIEINRQFIGHKKEELQRRIAPILLHFGPACVVLKQTNNKQKPSNDAENERKTIKSTNLTDTHTFILYRE